MVTSKTNSVYGFGVMGDVDRSEFSFNKQFTYDELTELLERNPRISMQCDWMAGEALKNGWKWIADGTVEYEGESLSYDDYLEVIHGKAKLHRGIMFARLHGTAAAVFNEDFTNFKIWHKSNSKSGWYILKDDIDEKGQPFQITLKTYKEIDEPMVGKPSSFDEKISLDRVVFLKNPKKGERWGGTPSSKLIAHVAQAEELLLKAAVKHGFDIANSFLWFKNTHSTEEAADLHEQVLKMPLIDLYTENIEMEAMNSGVNGATDEYKTLSDLFKDYIACGMRVSRQAMDGAPEGTLSSAEYNTIMSYAVIKEIQEHWKPMIEDIFRKLQFANPNIEWNEPMDDQPKEKDGNDNDA